MPIKPKLKKKGDSFERYARAIQNDIAGLSESMKAGFQSAQKDIQKVREDMVTKAEFKEVRDDVKRITDAMISKADLEALREELLREIRDGKHIDELRQRLAVVERKLGLERSRRAG